MTSPDFQRTIDHTPSIQYLKRADPVLSGVIERVGACTLEPRREGTHFDALLRAIVYQQLSGKAAATIHGRVVDLFGGRAPTPNDLITTPDEALRAAGLSRQKLSYLKDLAAKVASGLVPLDEAEVDRLRDDEIIDRLVQVKGIGRWTAHMFLMFRLGRIDVLPELDLGVQNAIRRAYRLRKHPSPQDVRRIGAKWSPHATIACWYLWRSLELPTPAKKKRARNTAKKKPARGAKKHSSPARGARKAARAAVKKRRR